MFYGKGFNLMDTSKFNVISVFYDLPPLIQYALSYEFLIVSIENFKTIKKNMFKMSFTC